MDVFLYGKWIKWEDDERMSEIKTIKDWQHMIDLLDVAETEVERLKKKNEQLKKESLTGLELANIKILLDRLMKEKEDYRFNWTECAKELTRECIKTDNLKHDYSQQILELLGTNEQLLVSKTNLHNEIEQLRQEIELNCNLHNEQFEYTRQEHTEQVQILLDDKKQLNFEIEQLRKALKRCCPHCESIDKLAEPACCIFCGGFLLHADNCEYLRLVGGGEVD